MEKEEKRFTIKYKREKELAGGKRLHLLVAILHGHSVICIEPYEKMSGAYIARLIRRKSCLKSQEKGSLSFCLSCTMICHKYLQ